MSGMILSATLDWLPSGPLQGSVLVTIFVGIVFAVLFAEVFGWNFSGLVVPGYLAPILIVMPFALLVILLEALLSYALVRWLSDRLGRWRLWPPLFGRERFAVIVLSSILVRVVVELWGLPVIGAWVQQWAPTFDFRSRFFGIGLLAVPLVANVLWKPGVVRGLGQLSVLTGLTWAFTSFILLPLTNFQIGRFYNMYETAALDFAASPGSYAVIIVGCLLVARANLKLGWDTGGILVPTLLALGLLAQPWSLFSTLGEACLILALLAMVKRLPGIRGLTFEGPRLLLAAYALGFALKCGIAAWASRWWPQWPYEHAFGYGYLLTSLIAIKMWQKRAVVRTALALSQLAVGTVLLGVLLMGALRIGFEAEATLPLPGAAHDIEPRTVQDRPYDVLADALGNMLLPSQGRKVARMLPGEEQTYVALVQNLVALHQQDAPLQRLRQLIPAAADLGFDIVVLRGSEGPEHVLLWEPVPQRGWGAVVVRLGEAVDLLVEAPRPLLEPRAAEAALALYELTEARAMLLPGAHARTNGDRSSDPLLWERLPFRLASAALLGLDVLEVRSGAETARLWCPAQIPADLRFAALGGWLGQDPQLQVGGPPPTSQRRLHQDRRRAFASLQLDARSLGRLLYARACAAGLVGDFTQSAFRAVSLPASVCEQPALAERRSPQDEPLAPGPRARLEREVLLPLLQLNAQLRDGAGQWREHLGVASWAAARHGYDLQLLQDGGVRFALLAPQDGPVVDRGSFLFRLAVGQDLHLLASQPSSQLQLGPAAVELAQLLSARVLSLGPWQGGAAEDWARTQPGSLFDLVHEVVVRAAQGEGGDGSPERPGSTESHLTLEVRGGAALPGAEDAVLREARLLGGVSGLSPEVRQLCGALQECGLRLVIQPDERAYARFASRSLPALRRSQQTRARHASLWLSRDVRRRLAERLPEPRLLLTLQALGLPLMVAQHTDWPAPAAGTGERRGLQLATRELIAYQQSGNVVHLERMVQLARSAAVDLQLLHDPQLGAYCVALRAPTGSAQVLVRLAPLALRLERSVDLPLRDWLENRSLLFDQDAGLSQEILHR